MYRQLKALAREIHAYPACQTCDPGQVIKTVHTLTGYPYKGNLPAPCDHQPFEFQRLQWRIDNAIKRIEEFQEELREAFPGLMPPPAFKGAWLPWLDDRESSRAGLAAARHYVESWDDRLEAGQGLILVGGVGTGKTTVAVALSRSIEAKRNLVLFTTVTGLQGMLREFDKAELLMKALHSAELLILDDFGAERPTEWSASQLFEIIDGRCQRDLPTIFTSNLRSKELTDHYVRCLVRGKDQMPKQQAELTVARVLSRIKQRNLAIEFSGPDHRLANAPRWLEETIAQKATDKSA